MTTLSKDTLENISVIYRQEISASGNKLDELKSGLQKSIRRNIPENAARCGAELYCFVYKKQGKRIFTNLIHRLMIIYLEDIGLAGVSIWDFMDKFIDQILYSVRGEVNEKGDVIVENVINDRITSEAALIYLIEYLCKLPHSRILSHFHSVFFPTDSDIEEILVEDLYEIREIRKRARSWKIIPNPDPRIRQELDKITQDETIEVRNCMVHLGTAILRQDSETAYECLLALNDAESKTRSTFLEDEDTKYTGTRVSKSNSILNIILPVLCLSMKILKIKQEGFLWEGDSSDVVPPNLILLTRKWYKELEGTKEGDLPLRLSILTLSMFLKGNLTSRKILGKYKLTLEVEDIFKDVGNDLEIYSYAVDMHTKKGRSLGKNRVDFAKEGAYVVNEDEKVIVEDYKEIYNRFKYNQAGIEYTENTKKESDKFVVVSRVQLTCSKSRPCTYFAKDKDQLMKNRMDSMDNLSTIYFVKGPYKCKADAYIPLKLSKLKEEINDDELPYLKYKVIKLIPDLFEDVPLGIRKNIDRSKPAYFLVCESLLQEDESEIPTTEASSKLWKDEKVVDWEEVEKNNDLKRFNFNNIVGEDNEKRYLYLYVIGLLWRYIIGIPDPADRNFMCINQDSNINNMKMYSLDEENIKHPSEYKTALKGNRYKYFKKYINKYKTIIKEKLEKWRANIHKSLIFDQNTLYEIISRLNYILNNIEAIDQIFSD